MVGLLVLSCSKDSSTPSLNTTQAQAAIGDVNTNLASDIGTLSSTAGNAALNSFTNLTSTTSPFGRIKSFNKPGEIKAAMSAGLISIRQMILKGTSNERVQGDDTPFDFNGKKGIYNYNLDTKAFVKSQETSTIIKIRYPKDANSVTNDAELQITAYTDVQTSDGYQPTAVEAAIYISDTKEVGLSLTAQYNLDKGEPVKASIAVFINPFTITFSFDNTPATSASESFSLSKSGTVLIGVGATATWASANDKENGEPRAASGYLQLKNVRFSIAVDGSKAATATSRGDFIVITVSADGAIAGHVVWVGTSVDNEEPYMQYNDGTTREALSSVFADLSNQLQALVNG